MLTIRPSSTSQNHQSFPRTFDEPIFNCNLEVCSPTVFGQASHRYSRMSSLSQWTSLHQPCFRSPLSCAYHLRYITRHEHQNFTLLTHLMSQSCLVNNIHRIMWVFCKRYCTKCQRFMVWVDMLELWPRISMYPRILEYQARVDKQYGENIHWIYKGQLCKASLFNFGV